MWVASSVPVFFSTAVSMSLLSLLVASPVDSMHEMVFSGVVAVSVRIFDLTVDSVRAAISFGAAVNSVWTLDVDAARSSSGAIDDSVQDVVDTVDTMGAAAIDLRLHS
jgi:hypothetical protein